MGVGLSLELWVVTEDDKDALGCSSRFVILNELVKEAGPLYRLEGLGKSLALGDDLSQPLLGLSH